MESWTLPESHEYFVWLRQIAQDRIQRLVEHLGVDVDESALLASDVRAVLDQVAHGLRSGRFTTTDALGDVVLNEAGSALLFDVAVFVGEALVRHPTGAWRWEIVTAPKFDFAYGRPVIYREDDDWLYFDVFTVAAVYGRRVARGTAKDDFLYRQYMRQIQSLSSPGP